MELKDFDAIITGQLPASAVTVGNFDGVHVGHREIIRAVRRHGERLHAPSVVITFDPHPREVIFRGQQVPAIIPFKERARLIAELGVDLLVKVNFTPEFAERTAGEFIAEAAAKLNPKAVVIGHDFRFGKDRKGDEAFLREEGKERGFEVEVVAAVEVDGKPVSSSRIRGMIQAGEMRRVRRLLGAPFCVEGEVVAGHGRGKGMGFATANLKWEALLIPPDGVYAALAYWNDHCLPAVVNIGNNPTFGDQAVAIEAHLLDFSGDLYEKRMRIALIRRLRGEVKFGSADELVKQIKEDVKRAREELKSEYGDGP
jgi:riboflavin kinase/FMN adenylyltransferase